MTNDSTPNRPVWRAETQDPARAEEIRKALYEVTDPELGFNVIQLGMIRDVSFEEGKVAAHMILTTPFCPYGPAMIEEVRRKIAVTTQLPTTVEMIAEMWTPSMMDEEAAGEWGFWNGSF
jgi:metal-sulfur cluster biosynthetic enzyme